MLVEWSDLVEWPGVILILSLVFAVHLFGGLTVTIERARFLAIPMRC
jgi:hypothetical protein